MVFTRPEPVHTWGSLGGPLLAHEIHLATRPHGLPEPGDFAVVTVELAPPGPGEILVRNLYMSVEPYTRVRGRTTDPVSSAPPFPVGEALDGPAVGEVVESMADGLRPGDLVLHGYGWRDQAVIDARNTHRIDPIPGVPPSAYLGALGMTTLSAYVGLLDVAGFRPGDAVFVTGASGAIGSMVGQIARLKGASRVVGSAGSQAKVDYLTRRLGFHAAFDYHEGSVAENLARVAPRGIDVCFDNVGGEHLEAAISALNLHGRVAMCGAVSVYNSPEAAAGPRNISLVIGKRLSLRGFSVHDHMGRMQDMMEEVGAWLREGRIVYQETVVHGLEFAPAAFAGLMRGETAGKMIVRIRPST
ncbi:NADP-dependent oxidoreductase [Thermopolyspora sp. NPDC052614]|uniref:NADP-dependent oxidoreductase n=1 Tax=Thermopolyspora sp. NPDC052614 TaxID=3155682 RepID=UPI00342C24A2